MAKLRHLAKAPITEALIDLRVKLPQDFQAEQFFGLKERLRGRYPMFQERPASKGPIEIKEGKPIPQAEDKGLHGFFFISEDGLIVLSSKDVSNDIDVESVAADAANIFNSDANYYKDVVFSINEAKVYITRMDSDGSKPMMFMTILPHNVRYFKRKINKIRNKIRNFFI